MKIRVVFEFNSTNSSSADTNLDNFRFYQKFQIAPYLAVQRKFKRNKEGKYLNGGGENEKRKEKIRKKKEEIKTMQRGDRGYRRVSNCEIAAVNKGLERRCYISKYVLTYGHTITIIAIKRC